MMDSKEEIANKKKAFLKNCTLGYRVLVLLRIELVWFKPRNHSGYWRHEKMNKRNPLTWLFLLLLTPIAGIIGMANFLKESMGEFKTKKYG